MYHTEVHLVSAHAYKDLIAFSSKRSVEMGWYVGL